MSKIGKKGKIDKKKFPKKFETHSIIGKVGKVGIIPKVERRDNTIRPPSSLEVARGRQRSKYESCWI